MNIYQINFEFKLIFYCKKTRSVNNYIVVLNYVLFHEVLGILLLRRCQSSTSLTIAKQPVFTSTQFSIQN